MRGFTAGGAEGKTHRRGRGGLTTEITESTEGEWIPAFAGMTGDVQQRTGGLTAESAECAEGGELFLRDILGQVRKKVESIALPFDKLSSNCGPPSLYLSPGGGEIGVVCISAPVGHHPHPSPRIECGAGSLPRTGEGIWIPAFAGMTGDVQQRTGGLTAESAEGAEGAEGMGELFLRDILGHFGTSEEESRKYCAALRQAQSLPRT